MAGAELIGQEELEQIKRLFENSNVPPGTRKLKFLFLSLHSL